jgi:hypothetical protein
MMPSTMVTVGLTVRLPPGPVAEEVTCVSGALRTALLSGSRQAAASSAQAAGESAGASGSVSAPPSQAADPVQLDASKL